MASAAARFAVPIRQVLSCQRATAIRSCVQRPQTYNWRGQILRRAFSVKPALEVKKYTEDHEWIELDDDGKIGAEQLCLFAQHLLTGLIGTIGITEYASKALGDVVYVELPEIGMEVSKGDSIGAVESVKSASDIMTPVSGKVTEANGLLEEKPGTINKGPEGEGWLAKIEVSDATELDSLMGKDEYDNFEKE